MTEADGTYDCPACFAHRALYLQCHLCGKRKYAETPERASYVMAFHLDRRHRGWTETAKVDADPSPAASEVSGTPGGENQ